MINVEILAYQLELKTKKIQGIELELHRNKAGFDLALLMGYYQEFRIPEVAGVLLEEGQYSVQYYGSIISSYETFLNQDLERIREKSNLLKNLEEVTKKFSRIEKIGANTLRMSLSASDVKFSDAEKFMMQMLKIFKIKSRNISLVPDIEFISSN